MAAHSDLVVAVGHCNAFAGIGDPFLPFAQGIKSLTGDLSDQWPDGVLPADHAERLRALLPRVADVLVAKGRDLLGSLVPREELCRRLQVIASSATDDLAGLQDTVCRIAELPQPAADHAHLIYQYARFVQALAKETTLLLILDDLQWADPSSLSLLLYLGRSLGGGRVLLLGAYRPGDVARGRGDDRHPLQPVVAELHRLYGDISVDLDRADGRLFVESLLDSEPNRLASPFREALYRHTAGHALFSTEVLRTLRDQGGLVRNASGLWQETDSLNWNCLPARMEAAIAERVGSLSAESRRVMQVASVEGEEFTAEVVAQALNLPAQEVVRLLGRQAGGRERLVVARGVDQVGEQRLSRYAFRHVLYQDYLYRMLEPAERSYLHEGVGRALEDLYEDQSRLIAGVLARHFAEAGLTVKAADYLERAAYRSRLMGATEEVLATCREGLALIDGDAATSVEKDEVALRLLHTLALGLTDRSNEGDPGLPPVLVRGEALARSLGRTRERCMMLFRLANHRIREGSIDGTPWAQKLRDVAQSTGDWKCLIMALDVRYTTLCWTADFQSALHVYRYRNEISDPHPDVPGSPPEPWDAAERTYLTGAAGETLLWATGYPEEAHRTLQEALTLTQNPRLPDVCRYHRLHLEYMTRLCARCGWYDEARERSETLLRSGRPDHLPDRQRDVGRLVCAWIDLAEGGEVDTPRSEIEAAVEAAWPEVPDGRGLIGLTTGLWSTDLLIDAHRRLGHLQRALALGERLLEWGRKTNTTWMPLGIDESLGKVLVDMGQHKAAEECLQECIALARQAAARGWELRAATTLARLWQSQGRHKEALDLLGPVYDWFTEGFDTTDLRAARALLDELTSGDRVA